MEANIGFVIEIWISDIYKYLLALLDIKQHTVLESVEIVRRKSKSVVCV